MATVKAVLNKDREKKKGGYTLVIQIIHKRVRRTICTPYALKAEEYDPVKQRVRYLENARFTSREVKEMNRFIKRKKQEIERLVECVAARKELFDADDVIIEYHQKQSDKYLFVFLERLIERKEKAGKLGLACALRSTLCSLRKFTGGDLRAVKFDDITAAFVKSYEMHLESRKQMRNTMNFYLRNFRSVYNLAFESGVEMKDNQPFRKIHIRSEQTKKRALSKEIIDLIASANLSCDKELDKARDVFMFSFYTRGMSFVDIIYLLRTDIVDGVIYYQRHKTHQYMRVAIIPQLQAIMDKYPSEDEYVLPLMNEVNQPTHYKKYRMAYSHLYRSLKALQKKLGVTTLLTMHVARHSWATIAQESGANTSIICQGMGHTSERTTAIYLRSFDNSLIDAMNATVAYFSQSK